MSWAKLDDRYDDHPKVRAARRRCPAAIALHVMAITYSCRHETDGVVSPEWLSSVLPRSSTRRRVVAVAVEVGLFDELRDGSLRVHSFLEHNFSRAQLEERRRRQADEKARKRAEAAERRAQTTLDVSTRTDDGHAVVSTRTSRADARAHGPDPTRPDLPPSPPTGGRQRDVARFQDQVRAYAAVLLPAAPAADATAIIAGAIRGGARTHADVEAYVERWRPDLAEQGAP